MEKFSKYMKDEEDIRKTLRKIPAAHRQIAEKFKVNFEDGHTLKNDPKHVGRVFLGGKKEITLANSYFYPREFVFLHEIGHLVFDNFVKGTPLEKEWDKVVLQNLNRNPKDNNEEAFCHNYAATYSKHPPSKFVNPYWSAFIRKIK